MMISSDAPTKTFGRVTMLKMAFFAVGLLILIVMCYTEAVHVVFVGATLGGYVLIYPIFWLLQLTRFGRRIHTLNKAVPMHIKSHMVRHGEFTMLCLGESVMQVSFLFFLHLFIIKCVVGTHDRESFGIKYISLVRISILTCPKKIVSSAFSIPRLRQTVLSSKLKILTRTTNQLAEETNLLNREKQKANITLKSPLPAPRTGRHGFFEEQFFLL
jgi:hypothetical protein